MSPKEEDLATHQSDFKPEHFDIEQRQHWKQHVVKQEKGPVYHFGAVSAGGARSRPNSTVRHAYFRQT